MAKKQGLWQNYSQSSSSDLGQNTAGGSASSSSSSNSKKRSFFSRLFSCSSAQTDDAGERPFSSQQDAAESQPSSSPSKPEGKGASGNKGGQVK